VHVSRLNIDVKNLVFRLNPVQEVVATTVTNRIHIASDPNRGSAGAAETTVRPTLLRNNLDLYEQSFKIALTHTNVNTAHIKRIYRYHPMISDIKF